MFVALRLFRESHAKPGIESVSKEGYTRGTLIDINVDRLYPALKNIKSYLTESGRLPVTRTGELLEENDRVTSVVGNIACRLYFCEIDTDLSVEFWESRNEIDFVLPKVKLEEFTLSIRCKSGAAYIEACEQYAQGLPLPEFLSIRYVPPTFESDSSRQSFKHTLSPVAHSA